MYEETVKDFEVEMKKLKNDNFTLQSTIEKLQCELRENRISMSHLHSDDTVNLQVHSSVSDVRTEYEAKLETKLQEIENLNTEIKTLNEKLIVQNTKEQESKEVMFLNKILISGNGPFTPFGFTRIIASVPALQWRLEIPT